MAGYIGSRAVVATSGVERKRTFAITTTTTSLTGLDYTPNHVHVFHNGIRLVDGTDYTATNGTSVTLVNAAENGDEVVVVSYGTFSPADTYTKSETYTKTEADDRYVNASGDTMTGQLDTPYQVIKGDIDYIGMSIRNTKANYSTSFIDAQNRTNAADSHIFFHHETDGSSTISFGTQPAGDFTDRRISGRMLINGNGHVTMPYQPMFSAFTLATGSQYPITYSTWATFDSNLTNFDSPRYSVEANTGSHYSISNGRFTAPVAGRYLVSVNVGMWVGNTTYITFFRNGSYSAPYQLAYNANLGGYQNMTLVRVMTLAAGDYVEPGFYASSGSSATYIPGGGYIQFSGYLIG